MGISNIKKGKSACRVQADIVFHTYRGYGKAVTDYKYVKSNHFFKDYTNSLKSATFIKHMLQTNSKIKQMTQTFILLHLCYVGHGLLYSIF